MKVVRADKVDFGELASAFALGYSDYLVKVDTSIEAFRHHISGNDVSLTESFVAIDEGIVGVALSGVRGERGWIGGMAVAPDHRRRGIGDVLLSAQLADLGSLGVRTVQLEVIDGNAAARALYEKNGFRETRTLHCLASTSKLELSIGEDVDVSECEWTDIEASYPPDQCWQLEPSSVTRMGDITFLMAMRAAEHVGHAVLSARDGSANIHSLAGERDALLDWIWSKYRPKGVRAINVPDGELSRHLTIRGFSEFLSQREMRRELVR